MKLIALLAIAISVLLAVSVACSGDDDNARVTPNTVSDSEDGVDDEGDEGDEEGTDEVDEDGEGEDDVADEEPPADEEGGSGFATPWEAVSAFLEDTEFGHAGDCGIIYDGLVLGDKVMDGFCSTSWEDRGDTQIYLANSGFIRSMEPQFFLLLVRQGGTWTVADTADFTFGTGEKITLPW